MLLCLLPQYNYEVIHAKSDTAYSAYDCVAVTRLWYVMRLLEGRDYVYVMCVL